MCMGLMTGNTQFQCMTEHHLRELDFADAFVDDIIVSSSTLGVTNAQLIEGIFLDVRQPVDVLQKQQLMCNGASAVFPPQRWSSRDRSWATEFVVRLCVRWRLSPPRNDPRTSPR